jgi:hypothetical protein
LNSKIDRRSGQRRCAIDKDLRLTLSNPYVFENGVFLHQIETDITGGGLDLPLSESVILDREFSVEYWFSDCS